MRRAAALLAALAALQTSSATAADGTDTPGLWCLLPPYASGLSEPDQYLVGLVADVRAALAPFPSLVETFDAAGLPVCLETRTTDARGYLDVDRGLIAVSDRLTRDQQLTIIVHELRHLDQLSRGFCPSNDLSMSENAHSVFAMEADAQAITALVAWAARERGEDGPWNAVTGWPEYGDIAERFGEAMRETQDAGLAVSAAFEQWYASDTRVTHYYYAACSDYLDRLDSTKLLPSYGLLDTDFYEMLCLMPDGTRYTCAPPEDAD